MVPKRNLNDSLVFNTQKYYISIKAGKNIAFIKVRNKKVRFIEAETQRLPTAWRMKLDMAGWLRTHIPPVLPHVEGRCRK